MDEATVVVVTRSIVMSECRSYHVTGVESKAASRWSLLLSSSLVLNDKGEAPAALGKSRNR